MKYLFKLLNYHSISCYLTAKSFYLTETDMQYAAKVYRDDRLKKKADALSMENCKELERLTSLYKGG